MLLDPTINRLYFNKGEWENSCSVETQQTPVLVVNSLSADVVCSSVGTTVEFPRPLCYCSLIEPVLFVFGLLRCLWATSNLSIAGQWSTDRHIVSKTPSLLGCYRRLVYCSRLQCVLLKQFRLYNVTLLYLVFTRTVVCSFAEQKLGGLGCLINGLTLGTLELQGHLVFLQVFL